MTSHWSSAPSSTIRKKSRQAGLQSKDGDVPEETSIVTGPVHSGSGPPGLVGSDEHAARQRPRAKRRRTQDSKRNILQSSSNLGRPGAVHWVDGGCDGPDHDPQGLARAPRTHGGTFEGEVEDITDVTRAHIHSGDANTAGPIAVELFNAGGKPVDFTDRATLATGTFDETDINPASGVDTMEELIAAMEAGNTYVNVHTSANSGGEIRGQLSD